MKKMIKMIAGVIIVLGFSFFYAHIDKNFYLYDRNIDSNSYINTGIIYGKEGITQSFTCESDVLDGMNVKCTVEGEVKDIVLEYSFKDESTGEIAADGSLNASDIKNNKFNYFQTNQLADTRGKKYIFSIYEKGSTEEVGVCFYVVKDEKDEKDTEITINGKKEKGILVSRAVGAQFDLETFIVVVAFAVYLIAFIRFLYKLFM